MRLGNVLNNNNNQNKDNLELDGLKEMSNKKQGEEESDTSTTCKIALKLHKSMLLVCSDCFLCYKVLIFIDVFNHVTTRTGIVTLLIIFRVSLNNDLIHESM